MAILYESEYYKVYVVLQFLMNKIFHNTMNYPDLLQIDLDNIVVNVKILITRLIIRF